MEQVETGYPEAEPVRRRWRDLVPRHGLWSTLAIVVASLLAASIVWFSQLEPLALDIHAYGPGESLGMDHAIKYRPDGEARWYFTIENGGPLPVTLTSITLRDDPLTRLEDVRYETNGLSLGRPLEQARLGSGDEVRLMVRARLSPCPLDRTPDRGTTFGFDVPIHVLRYETLGVSRTSTVALDLSVTAPARFLCFELYG